MEELIIAQTLLIQALKTFKESFDVVDEAQATGQPRLLLAAEDSCIQRFEYSFDSFWKFSKRYLENILDLEGVNSPRSAFTSLLNQNVVSPEEAEVLILMLNDRNKTTHNYNAQQVREIFPNLKPYYDVMQSIVDRLQTSDVTRTAIK